MSGETQRKAEILSHERFMPKVEQVLQCTYCSSQTFYLHLGGVIECGGCNHKFEDLRHFDSSGVGSAS